MQPSDRPAFHWPALWFPLPPAYLSAGASSIRTARASADARRAGDGSPALRTTGFLRGEARTSRVAGPSSSCAPWSNTPPDTTLPCPYFSSRRSTEGPSSPSGSLEPSASGLYEFRDRNPTAHTLACLRIAGHIAETVARLATGWAGSPLAGRDSHLLDDKSKFQGVIAFLLFPSTSIAWSHWTARLGSSAPARDSRWPFG